MERQFRSCRVVAVGMLLFAAAFAWAIPVQAGQASTWREQMLAVPYEVPVAPTQPVLQAVRLGYGNVERGQSVMKTPMQIGARKFDRGLGTHAVSDIKVFCPEPIRQFSAWIGADANPNAAVASLVFSVATEEKELYQSPVMHQNDQPRRIRVDVDGARVLHLRVGDAGDGISCDHADWADARVVTESGKTLWLDEFEFGAVPTRKSLYPFSFLYGDVHSDQLLPGWESRETTTKLDDNREQTVKTWTDPKTGLKIEWQIICFSDFPAVEWILHFQNNSSSNTPILADIQSLDWYCQEPWIDSSTQYRLYKTNGAPSNPTDFEAETAPMEIGSGVAMGGGAGRSSNKDFPFFKIEAAGVSYIIAVGWSGQWLSDIACERDGTLHVRAGLEKTHLLLYPGERVRMPRILMLRWEGDTWESNAQFRQLIYRRYAAKRDGERLLPTPYCNTCFTRGGGWLNETTAENQISLINVYAYLGAEAVLTDAGWFEGGWPAGAGNWTPRKDHYPDGMAPVALAAKEKGIIYGLWFEPERVVAGTDAHVDHPDWCLASTSTPQSTYLLNFGLPEVQDYFFNIVKGFMDLPGFAVYRQDFNMNPLAYWRYNDTPDRQGMTEIRYIEGLYAYWDRIAEAWPDSLRIECSSGGRRIDLETITRMHIHQKSDYWFHNEVDQASIWGLNQYLPNNTIHTPINRLDTYSFHSAMATSLNLGWIADAPDFDTERAAVLLKRYREVRHLMVGGAYPLTPYSRDTKEWLASQYHRPDLDEGMILVFRRSDSPYRALDATLHGLVPQAVYEIASDRTGIKQRCTGAELMECYTIMLDERHSSDLIVYRKARR